MPIDLGLTRIATLLARLGNPHRSANFIHVAGTNGKGSVCAYLSSLLSNTTQLKIGKFTSPHLIHRHDCVMLNNYPVDRSLFEEAELAVKRVDEQFSIGATEFELLTATAFHIFHSQNVDLAVMEVGLGGRLDSTNVLEPAVVNSDGYCLHRGVIATAITKIGLDHENILGSNLSEIAFEKAGIIKDKIPNVVDGTNDVEVLEVVKKKAIDCNSSNYIILPQSDEIETLVGTINRSLSPLHGNYQLQNLSIALKVIDLVFPFLQKNYPIKTNFTLANLEEGVKRTQWPGRLQELRLKYSKDQPSLPVILDGAHNGQAARELATYLKTPFNGPITFVLAVTKGKHLEPLLSQLVTAQDKVIVTKFGKVDGMPWIQCNDPVELEKEVKKYTNKVHIVEELPDVFKDLSQSDNVVICGSLYLVGQCLSLHEDNL